MGKQELHKNILLFPVLQRCHIHGIGNGNGRPGSIRLQEKVWFLEVSVHRSSNPLSINGQMCSKQATHCLRSWQRIRVKGKMCGLKGRQNVKSMRCPAIFQANVIPKKKCYNCSQALELWLCRA